MQEKRRVNLSERNILASSTVTPLLRPPATLAPRPQVIDALYSIQTTPFESSFLSRLQGTKIVSSKAIAVDWETITPWISLMNDIREHYVLSQ